MAALAAYFRAAPPHDAAWAAYFLTGRKLKRLVGTRDLVGAALAASGIPAWLFEASYAAVGDLAETIALLLPPPTRADDRSLAAWVEDELAPLAGLPSDDVQARLRDAWDRLDRDERFVFGKLLTGAFRVGAARQLVHRALAEATGVPIADVAHRLIGHVVAVARVLRLAARRGPRGRRGRASAVSVLPRACAAGRSRDARRRRRLAGGMEVGRHSRAAARARRRRERVVARRGARQRHVSRDRRGGARAAAPAPCSTARSSRGRTTRRRRCPFAALQQRLNRKAPGPKLRQSVPVVLIAYDLLEHEGVDLRALPLAERRARLEALLPIEPTLKLSPTIDACRLGRRSTRGARSRARAAPKASC